MVAGVVYVPPSACLGVGVLWGGDQGLGCSCLGGHAAGGPGPVPHFYAPVRQAEQYPPTLADTETRSIKEVTSA